MQQHVSSIMLAGTILPTPFQEALGVPMLCLPIGRTGSMLDAWRRVLGQLDRNQNVRLVVKSPAELKQVSALVKSQSGHTDGPAIDVIREPGAWRGVAGLLHDLTRDRQTTEIVVVCEAHCHPPRSLQPMLEAMSDDTIGVVGITERGEPAGVYAFRIEAFDGVSRIGYCDLKEQLLPILNERGLKVIAQPVSERVQRLRDLDSYLAAVRASLRIKGETESFTRRVAALADVSPSATLDGFCVIEPGATIEDGAVIHDSVVLSGAVVGGGAVVSRSVVGPRVRVKPRSQVVHDVLPSPRGAADDMLQVIISESGSTSAA